MLGQVCLKNNAYNGYWTAEKLEDIAMTLSAANEKLYYLLPNESKDKGESTWRDMLYLQYMLVDKILYVVNEESMENIYENDLLIIEKNIPNYVQYIEKEKIIAENELLIIIRR